MVRLQIIQLLLLRLHFTREVLLDLLFLLLGLLHFVNELITGLLPLAIGIDEQFNKAGVTLQEAHTDARIQIHQMIADLVNALIGRVHIGHTRANLQLKLLHIVVDVHAAD